MLSFENDDLKFLKSTKNYHVHHSSRALRTVLSLQTNLSLTSNINVKVTVELYHLLSKILKFRYW